MAHFPCRSGMRRSLPVWLLLAVSSWRLRSLLLGRAFDRLCHQCGSIVDSFCLTVALQCGQRACVRRPETQSKQPLGRQLRHVSMVPELVLSEPGQVVALKMLEVSTLPFIKPRRQERHRALAHSPMSGLTSKATPKLFVATFSEEIFLLRVESRPDRPKASPLGYR